jgi:hypothetical protein
MISPHSLKLLNCLRKSLFKRGKRKKMQKTRNETKTRRKCDRKRGIKHVQNEFDDYVMRF